MRFLDFLGFFLATSIGFTEAGSCHSVEEPNAKKVTVDKDYEIIGYHACFEVSGPNFLLNHC